MSHVNSGSCPKCAEIFSRFDGFNSDLRDWFEEIAAVHKDFHISSAGRGRDEQEALVLRGASRAGYGKSSHSWNAAIDTFVLSDAGIYTLPEDYYIGQILPKLPNWIEWYGHPEYKRDKQKYYELPHFEIKTWHAMATQRLIKLVE